jgi:hypothetical protein
MVISREFFTLEKSQSQFEPINGNVAKQRPETMLYHTVVPLVGNKTASLAFVLEAKANNKITAEIIYLFFFVQIK